MPDEYKVALCFVCYQVAMKLSKVTNKNKKANWEPAPPLTTSSFSLDEQQESIDSFTIIFWCLHAVGPSVPVSSSPPYAPAAPGCHLASFS